MTGLILREPNKGDRITADWARELVRAIRSMRLFAGPGVQLTETPSGITISVSYKRSANAQNLCDTTIGGGDSSYPADPYTPNPHPDDDEVEKVLASSGTTANVDEWELGDKIGGKICYPKFIPYRQVYDPSTYKLYAFVREVTHNAGGMLVAVGPEVRSVVFQAVEEMP